MLWDEWVDESIFTEQVWKGGCSYEIIIMTRKEAEERRKFQL